MKKSSFAVLALLIVASMLVTPARAGTGRVGMYSSMALDSNGNPHISYYDSTNGDLKYAMWTGLAWSIETVDSIGDVGSYTSIVLDSVGNPCISYRDNTNGNLKYAHWDGSTWNKNIVDKTGHVGSFSSIALDSDGQIHISYYDDTLWNLKYAKGDGSNWVIQTLDETGNVGLFTSIALDSIGPCISYFDNTNGDLKYAHWTGTAWDISIIDSVGTVGAYTSIVLDDGNIPCISYYDTTNGDLKYAHWNVGTLKWDIEVVDSTGDVGLDTSITIDSTGINPWISYYGYSSGWVLKNAHRIGVNSWVTSTIDNVDGIFYYTSIALQTGDIPCISYFDETNDALKYAHWADPKWSVQYVDFGSSPAEVIADPQFGGPGTPLNIKGSYFTPNAQVEIYFNTYLYQTITTGTGGAFSYDGVIPNIAPGFYNLIVKETGLYGVGVGMKASTPFKIGTMDVITSNPSGQFVWISGNGFSLNGAWSATLQGVNVASGTASNLGIIQGSFVAPGLSAGTYQLYVLDVESGITVDGNNLVMTGAIAQISSSPVNGAPGTSVTITGTGLTPVAGTNVDIFFGTQPVGSVQTTAAGTFSQTVAVPNIGVGQVNIVARDTSGIEASTPFTILGGATITWYTVPEKAPISTQVTIKGYHFTPSNTWTAKINGVTITGSANSKGEILGTFTAPNTIGKYTLEVTDDHTSRKSTFELEVTSPVIPPPTNQATYAGSTNNQYPSNIELTLENLWPYPVQSALYPDIKADKTIDLVIGKDTTITVDVSGVVGVNWPLTINFNGVSIPLTVDKKNPNGMLFFKGFPLLSAPEGVKQIVLSDSVGVLTTVDTNAYLTQNLQVTYINLQKPGSASNLGDLEFQSTVDKTNTLIGSTYPVTISNKYTLTINEDSANMNPTGVENDCKTAASQAALNAVSGGYTVGVAIAPSDYFTAHGYTSDTVGLTWNPCCKGVVVIDGYYSGGAHEIGHTLNLYWPPPPLAEEYQQQSVEARGEPGYRATGVSIIDNYVRDGWDIMGAGAYKQPYDSWITTSTYVQLFNKLRSTTNDPELVLVSGTLHKDGTVTDIGSPMPWYRLTGTPDTIVSGSYSLKFMGATGPILETSFGAWFGYCIEPGENVAPGTPGFGWIETDYSPFCFLTECPAGTTEIRLMDNTDPVLPKTLAVIPASELVVYPRADAGGPYESFTKVATTFDARGSTGQGLKYRWDFNGDGVFDTVWLTTPTTTNTYATAWSGVAVLEVTDGHLTQRSEAQVTIYQQPTINKITAQPTGPQPVNTVVMVYAEFTNPIQSSAYTAKIDWGDGASTLGAVAFDNNLIKISGSHKYATAGIYTATVTLLYKSTTSATCTYPYFVIYDSSRGSVTGAGYYNSPAGAYKSDPKLAGKAAFVILAKYSKGASKPSGETDVVLGSGKLLFHSSSYSWLVVSGNKATYRGAGTLNLKPGYEFLLTVTDGGTKGVDKIRIKIWETATSKVIYDTQMGAPDTADPSIIAYGSVVVLK